jgi:tyrosine-specific transport protein
MLLEGDMKSEVSTLKGVFVFAATIIGAGILALPVAAANAGLFPTILILVIIGAMSIFSALYIAEAVLATEGVYHLPTLAEKYLGRTGLLVMLAGVIIYVYGALTGYLSAGGQLFNTLSNGALPVWLGVLIYFLIASIVVHFGLKLMSQIETYLFVGMLILLGLVMTIALINVRVPLLFEAKWSSTPGIFGVVLFAYVGHSVIPSIAAGLDKKRDINKIAVWGVVIPLLLYILWCVVVIGVVPKANLLMAKTAGLPATIPLGIIAGTSIALLGNVFAVLSTMTSYIGFGFSLKEVYRDTAGSFKKSLKPVLATGMVVIPPLLITLLKPGAFIKALEIAGTYGGGVFVGILPVLIVLKARKVNGKTMYMTWGGELTPYLVLGLYLTGMAYATYKLVSQVLI